MDPEDITAMLLGATNDEILGVMDQISNALCIVLERMYQELQEIENDSKPAADIEVFEEEVRAMEQRH
ncbi:unnamed protein product [Zymoseptoria tritici ST99CH_1E4]|uniref:Uncharacterized protein n=1 Tax=Zymoseptoria tritici ST99CH_1E4 TaxID=1276532 RepID=A0A2H1GJ48_ZYMTR|nr:unnamed protein product [Zymoseptoria tritici ST99CH_1E4]